MNIRSVYLLDGKRLSVCTFDLGEGVDYCLLELMYEDDSEIMYKSYESYGELFVKYDKRDSIYYYTFTDGPVEKDWTDTFDDPLWSGLYKHQASSTEEDGPIIGLTLEQLIETNYNYIMATRKLLVEALR